MPAIVLPVSRRETSPVSPPSQHLPLDQAFQLREERGVPEALRIIAKTCRVPTGCVRPGDKAPGGDSSAQSPGSVPGTRATPSWPPGPPGSTSRAEGLQARDPRPSRPPLRSPETFLPWETSLPRETLPPAGAGLLLPGVYPPQTRAVSTLQHLSSHPHSSSAPTRPASRHLHSTPSLPPQTRPPPPLFPLQTLVSTSPSTQTQSTCPHPASPSPHLYSDGGLRVRLSPSQLLSGSGSCPSPGLGRRCLSPAKIDAAGKAPSLGSREGTQLGVRSGPGSHRRPLWFRQVPRRRQANRP